MSWFLSHVSRSYFLWLRRIVFWKSMFPSTSSVPSILCLPRAPAASGTACVGRDVTLADRDEENRTLSLFLARRYIVKQGRQPWSVFSWLMRVYETEIEVRHDVGVSGNTAHRTWLWRWNHQDVKGAKYRFEKNPSDDMSLVRCKKMRESVMRLSSVIGKFGNSDIILPTSISLTSFP